jgi:hypothetical protein
MATNTTDTGTKVITGMEVTIVKETRSTAVTGTTATTMRNMDTTDTDTMGTTISTVIPSTVTTPRSESSGKTTWSRSTG